MLDRRGQPGAQVYLWLVAQELPRAREARQAVSYVARTRSFVARQNLRTRDLPDFLEQLVEAHAPPSRDVDDFPRGPGGPCRKQVRGNCVGHEGEIARLLAVAEDDRRLVREAGGGKAGDAPSPSFIGIPPSRKAHDAGKRTGMRPGRKGLAEGIGLPVRT
jgi:hypothetical protein